MNVKKIGLGVGAAALAVLYLHPGPLGTLESLTYRGAYDANAYIASFVYKYVSFQSNMQFTSWDEWFAKGINSRYLVIQTPANEGLRVAMTLTDVTVAFALFLLIFFSVWNKYFGSKGKIKKTTTAHGTAAWAKGPELRNMRPKKGDIPLILGTVDRQTIALTLQQQCESILLVGPPGAGKTSGVIAPNLLREKGLRSLVVTDPKGELVEQTSGAISENHDVWVVNFVDPTKSKGYNPLAYAKTHLDAYKLAMTWVTNTGRSGNDPFWDSAASTIICAAVEHLNCVLADSGGASLSDLADFLCDVNAQQIIDTLQDSPDPDARKTARGFLASVGDNEKLMGSVFADIAPRFTIMRDPRIRACTGSNEVDFKAMVDLDKRPVCIYLVIDRALIKELEPLCSLFITQMFDSLIRVADASKGCTLPRPVFLFLDELANIGKINGLPTWITTVRSAKIGALLAVQDTAQLENLYEKTGRQTIMTACNTKLCLAKVTSQDAEYFSTETGKATVITRNAGFSKGQGSNSGSGGEGEAARPLLLADEIRRMPSDQMLVISGNTAPIKVKQIRWYENKALKDRAFRDVPEGTVLRLQPLPEPPGITFVSDDAPAAPSAFGGDRGDISSDYAPWEQVESNARSAADELAKEMARLVAEDQTARRELQQALPNGGPFADAISGGSWPVQPPFDPAMMFTPKLPPLRRPLPPPTSGGGGIGGAGRPVPPPLDGPKWAPPPQRPAPSEDARGIPYQHQPPASQ